LESCFSQNETKRVKIKKNVFTICAARDTELRQLRKQTTELEEQNAILSKHLDNMRQAVDRLDTDLTQMRTSNTALHQHYEGLKVLLAQRFLSLPLPGEL
jgi:predicted RNase H-like nuclease (RuvC/YqgF family)